MARQRNSSIAPLTCHSINSNKQTSYSRPIRGNLAGITLVAATITRARAESVGDTASPAASELPVGFWPGNSPRYLGLRRRHKQVHAQSLRKKLRNEKPLTCEPRMSQNSAKTNGVDTLMIENS